ncbi:MAG: hypothetical protein DRH04_11655, partial [Deltaproteobacteria bacterium]
QNGIERLRNENILAGNATILLFSCNVAGDSAGEAFVQALADWSGATVYASSNNTGPYVSNDGLVTQDWDLDVVRQPANVSPLPAPLAVAQVEPTVVSGTLTTLDGSKSTDADDGIASFSWAQLAGPNVSLSAASAASPTFVAPVVSSSETATFRLTVTDYSGQQSSADCGVKITATATLPAIPTDVAAYYQTSMNRNYINWNPVPGATGYKIYWDTSSGVTKTSEVLPETSTPGFGHTGVVSGSCYYYRVAAVNSAGDESALSAEASVCLADNIPAIPTGIAAIFQTSSERNYISWSPVADATGYKVYWGTSPGVTKTSEELPETPTFDFGHTGVVSGYSYYYRVASVNAAGESELSAEVLVKVTFTPYSSAGQLPDTGQTQCYDAEGNVLDSCPAPGEPFYGQDAQFQGPRSYTKLDTASNDLPDTATEWTMVRDNVTGLIWEVKSARNGTKDYNNPNDADNTYTWYNSDPEINGGDPGTPGDGTDTEDYINALNAANYGGHNDWRLPTPGELASLVNSGRYGPAIDADFFSGIAHHYYWSSTTYARDTLGACLVDFNYGGVNRLLKSYSLYACAVRSGASESLAPLVINDQGTAREDDDTVTDTNTSLMWKRTTSTDSMTWEAALAYCQQLNVENFGGCNNWRLPNVNELLSLVDFGRTPTVDNSFFLGSMWANFWSSTSYIFNTSNAWDVHLGFGVSYPYSKSYSFYVLAVCYEPSGYADALAISFPNGGETLTAGQDCTVTWKTDILSPINLQLYKGDTNILSIAENVDPSDLSYTFTIPANLEDGDDYRIRISSTADGTIFDFSDAVFAIASGSAAQNILVSCGYGHTVVL